MINLEFACHLSDEPYALHNLMVRTSDECKSHAVYTKTRCILAWKKETRYIIMMILKLAVESSSVQMELCRMNFFPMDYHSPRGDKSDYRTDYMYFPLAHAHHGGNYNKQGKNPKIRRFYDLRVV